MKRINFKKVLKKGNTEKYRIDPDGSMYVKQPVASGYGGLGAVTDYYFPCEELDGDEAYKLALFGGWFGLHKFRNGKFAQGLFYLLTCGCAGVCYAFDLVMMLTGKYYDTEVYYDMDRTGHVTQTKKRIYTRPVENRRWWISVPIAFVCALLLLNFVYRPAVSAISNGISSAIVQTAEEKAQNGDLDSLLDFEE